jgi:hypothetical protein
MNFLALLASRTKPSRKLMHDLQHAAVKKMLDVVSATPERFESQIRKVERETGKPIQLPPDINLEDIRKEYFRGAFELRVNIHNNQIMTETLKFVRDFLKLFYARQWAVIDFSNIHCEIVTSDDPVSIAWNVDSPHSRSPGFGMENTRVFIPISSQKVLVGAFRKSLLQLSPSHELALKINHITLAHAFRFAFSGSGEPKFQSASNNSNHPTTICELVKNRQLEGKTSEQIRFVNELGPMIALARNYNPNSLLI